MHLNMSIIPEHSLDLLQSAALAYMATIGPKGEPQVSAVWFTWDGTHLLFALNKGRQKYQNLLREPRVAIAIADPPIPTALLRFEAPSHVLMKIPTTVLSMHPHRSTSTGLRLPKRQDQQRSGW